MTDDRGFSDFFYAATDGLRLHARIYGSSNQDYSPVVCLPGLTRNCRDYHELAIYLSTHASTRRRVVAFDYRGRGQSAYDANIDNYNVVTEAGDVLAGLEALAIDSAAFIGTSRGGLIIHALGAMRPSVLTAVILNDIGPVLEAEGLAHIRSYLEPKAHPESLAAAVHALQGAHGRDFTALGKADWERMALAIHRQENGRLVPDFDPKLLEPLMAMDLSRPLPHLWPQFEALGAVPMLAIRGANSTLLSAKTFDEMRRRHPLIETITVEGQGHAPLLETGILPETIAGFPR